MKKILAIFLFTAIAGCSTAPVVVKFPEAPEVLKGLQATGIYKEQPGFFSRVIDMFKGAVAAPSTQSKGFSIKKLE